MDTELALLSHETAKLSGRTFDEFHENLVDVKSVKTWLDRLELSADGKAVLFKLAETSIMAGQTVVSIGRKVLSILISLIKSFPNTAAGVVIGATLSFLIGSIPILGMILGPILSPLLMAFGIGMGAVADFQTTLLRARMADLETAFEVLKI